MLLNQYIDSGPLIYWSMLLDTNFFKFSSTQISHFVSLNTNFYQPTMACPSPQLEVIWTFSDPSLTHAHHSFFCTYYAWLLNKWYKYLVALNLNIKNYWVGLRTVWWFGLKSTARHVFSNTVVLVALVTPPCFFYKYSSSNKIYFLLKSITHKFMHTDTQTLNNLCPWTRGDAFIYRGNFTNCLKTRLYHPSPIGRSVLILWLLLLAG